MGIKFALAPAFASVAATGIVGLGVPQSAFADENIPFNQAFSTTSLPASPPSVPSTPNTTDNDTDPAYRFPDEKFVEKYAEENGLSEEEAWNIANNVAGRPLEFDKHEAVCYTPAQLRHIYEREHPALPVKPGDPAYTGQDEPDSLEENMVTAHAVSIVDQTNGRSFLKLFDEEGDKIGLYEVEKNVEQGNVTYRFSRSSGSEELVGYKVEDTLLNSGFRDDQFPTCDPLAPTP